jgi:hypothetical protein
LSVAEKAGLSAHGGFMIKSARGSASPFELRREPPNKDARGVGAKLCRKRRSALKLRALGAVWRGRGRLAFVCCNQACRARFLRAGEERRNGAAPNNLCRRVGHPTGQARRRRGWRAADEMRVWRWRRHGRGRLEGLERTEATMGQRTTGQRMPPQKHNPFQNTSGCERCPVEGRDVGDRGAAAA